MKKTETSDRRETILAISMATLWVLTYFAARVLLKSYAMGTSLRVLVALAPIIPFVILLWMIIRGVREMDELELRIQLEALAVAFPLTFLMLMTLGLLELAIKLNPQDWSYRHLWPFMFVFYLFGLMMARRRYQ